jgi:hypothetical protein
MLVVAVQVQRQIQPYQCLRQLPPAGMRQPAHPRVVAYPI